MIQKASNVRGSLLSMPPADLNHNFLRTGTDFLCRILGWRFSSKLLMAAAFLFCIGCITWSCSQPYPGTTNISRQDSLAESSISFLSKIPDL